jgi:4-hydroxy-tetrahydrodipicolinate reductase
MIKVAVNGAGGRIISKIVKTLLKTEDMEVVAAIGRENTPHEGKDIGEMVGVGKIGVRVTGAQMFSEVLNKKKVDVMIDFTSAQTAVEAIQTAAECGVNVVVGTTGFSEAQMDEIKRSINENRVKAVISPNMAVGVNVFFKIIRDLAQILNDWDVEIIEAHHKHKTDAPSGTALEAYHIIADELGVGRDESLVCGRQGMVGARSPGEIGLHAVRGGDIVGDHTVLFAGEGERLEIIHRAGTRQAFVTGVIKAVQYVMESPEVTKGKITTMEDVLSLK